jgi:hypothetical protein
MGVFGADATVCTPRLWRPDTDLQKLALFDLRHLSVANLLQIGEMLSHSLNVDIICPGQVCNLN